MTIFFGSEPGSLAGVDKAMLGSVQIWPPPLWTPAAAYGSDLLAWFDAQAAATLDVSGVDALSWDNLGALGGTALAEADPPHYSATARNGLPGLSSQGSSGSNHGFNMSQAGLPTGNADSTILVIGYLHEHNGTYRSAVEWGTGGDNQLRGVWGYQDDSLMGFANGAANDYMPGINWYGEDQIMSFEYRGSDRQMSGTINGADTPPATRAMNAATGTDGPLELMTTPYLTLQEIMIVGRCQTAAERLKLHGYAAHKWGLTALLPAGHPYKTAPPTL